VIEELEIGNLKAFSGIHRAQLAPITLLYGANSAGKSSLIQSLLLLKQTFESTDPQQPALVLRGNLVDLGSVPGIMHGHDTSKDLVLGLRLSSPTRRSWLPPTIPQPDALNLTFGWDDDSRSVRQKSVSFSTEGSLITAFTRPRGPYSVRTPETTSRSEQLPFRIGQKAAREAFLSWALDAIPTYGPFRNSDTAVAIRNDRQRFLTLFRDHYSFAAGSFGLLPFMSRITPKAGAPALDDETELVLHRIQDLWMDTAQLFRFQVVEALETLAYLGPLRRAPQRFHLLSGARRSQVGVSGEYAAEMLSRDPHLKAHVNRWLEILEIPYRLDVIEIEDTDVRHSLGDVVVLVLTDARSGVALSPGDVGFGISQLLPIIVQSVASAGTTICIEQPEIHVHPRLQAHVADLLIDGHQTRGNQFLVETHSEHLMLRLQTRIRAGQLDPDAVAVLYVDTDASGAAYLVPIELNEDGSFRQPWPHGFFEERFEEMFGDPPPAPPAQ
jgi:hypothetical protein